MSEFIPGLICEACCDPIRRGESYTTIKDNMPVAGKHYFHADHAPDAPAQRRPPMSFVMPAQPGGPQPESN